MTIFTLSERLLRVLICRLLSGEPVYSHINPLYSLHPTLPIHFPPAAVAVPTSENYGGHGPSEHPLIINGGGGWRVAGICYQ